MEALFSWILIQKKKVICKSKKLTSPVSFPKSIASWINNAVFRKVLFFQNTHDVMGFFALLLSWALCVCLSTFQVFFFIFTISKSTEDFKLTVIRPYPSLMINFSQVKKLCHCLSFTVLVCTKKPHSILFPHVWFQSQLERQ